MRSVLLPAMWFACCGGLPAVAQDVSRPAAIPAGEAIHWVGRQVVVTGRVAVVERGTNFIRLRFEARPPEPGFEALVLDRHSGVFTNLDKLAGRTVAVNGLIAAGDGRPAMRLQTNAQLQVLPPARPRPPRNLRAVTLP